MTNKLNLDIEGMHCGSCASKVESSLKELQNVDNIKVDANKGTAEFEYTDERPSDKNIRRAIDKAGFTLTAIN